MDFFGAQAQARRQSRLLSWGFALCLLAVTLILDIAILTALRINYAVGRHPEPFGDSLTDWAMQHPGIVLATSVLVGGFIGIASMFRMLQLRAGGGYVARSAGGVRTERSTQDPRRRMLHNVVDEMALAAGIPAPEVYVLENEDSINAFAAGHTPANAAIAVTRGALQRLNREQLQGVVAHEFSHILNGDMRLSIRLMGLVFGLMAVAIAGRMLMRFSGGSNRRVAPILLLGVGVAIVGQVGFWGGRILQAWISRKRECLADASAVQFTRNPDGLRDALIRAAAMGVNRRVASSGMEEVAHMLFVSGADRILATHPPLLERIRDLDSNVNQAQLESMIRRVQTDWQRSPPVATVEAADTRAEDTVSVAAGIPATAAVPAAAALITGGPQQHHLDYAIALRRALPDALRGSADAPEQARALMLALVICADSAQREKQLEHIGSKLGSQVTTAVGNALLLTDTLQPLLRLPAVLQLFPSLRALPEAERASLVQLLHELVRMDGLQTVFEYALEKLVAHGLTSQLQPRASHGNATLADCAAQLGVLFAVLARHGAGDAELARRAYEAGIAPLLPMQRPAYSIMDDWVPLFDQALDALCALQPAAKQMLVEGMVRTIAHDGLVAPEEAELLRAVCVVLECPLPPVLPNAA